MTDTPPRLSERPRRGPRSRPPATRYKYEVSGKARDHQYEVIETRWDAAEDRFAEPRTFHLGGARAKEFFGFSPGLYGVTRSVWIYIPASMRWQTERTPIEVWLQNRKAFGANGISMFRYTVPPGSSLRQQTEEVPPLFRAARPWAF